MTDLYFQIEPDNWLKQGVTRNPRLPLGISFIQGSMIATAGPQPLVFEVDFAQRSEVPHFIGDTIPVFSDTLVNALSGAGVGNFQIFPALLRSTVSGEEWGGFKAFNAIGLLGAADLARSDFDTLMEGDPNGVALPLLAFNKLVLDRARIGKLSLFRLAESPVMLIISDAVNQYLDDHPPADGWGFDATEIEAI